MVVPECCEEEMAEVKSRKGADSGLRSAGPERLGTVRKSAPIQSGYLPDSDRYQQSTDVGKLWW